MKKLSIAIAALLIPLAGLADNHETSIVEMWQCALKDGKTMEEVEATNKKWLAMTRKAAGSEEVNSYALTTEVGDLEHFLFVDAYPTMAAWAAAKSAEETEEGEAIDDSFEELMDCTKNRLYTAKKH
jgi:hypothetical protein